jgi:large conductance mechanosensitive channel
MLKEFKEFAMKGSMLDMAIGIVIGAAFGTVIKSHVDDLLMPVVSSLFNAPDFTQLFVVLRAPEMTLGTDSLEEFRKAGGVAFAYGNFINALIAFLLVAFALYIVVKNVNKLKKKEEAAPAPDPGPSEVDLLKEIRDSLKK